MVNYSGSYMDHHWCPCLEQCQLSIGWALLPPTTVDVLQLVKALCVGGLETLSNLKCVQLLVCSVTMIIIHYLEIEFFPGLHERQRFQTVLYLTEYQGPQLYPPSCGGHQISYSLD